MIAPVQNSQPMTETLRQHIADYLAEREPDSYGDIDAAFTSAQRDELVEVLRSHASLKARIEELDKFVCWIETWTSNPVEAYSVQAIDGLFGMTRDKINALRATASLNPTGAK